MSLELQRQWMAPPWSYPRNTGRTGYLGEIDTFLGGGPMMPGMWGRWSEGFGGYDGGW